MTKVKICGITNQKDAAYCVTSGADFLGFVFYERSPRFITPEAARDIIEDLPPGILKVGVFVNQDAGLVKEIAKTCSLDYLQFHGDESRGYLTAFKPYRVIKALRIKDDSFLSEIDSIDAQLLLFDTFKKEAFGGTGETFDWGLLGLLRKLKRPFIVSGGLTPDNVAELIAKVNPFAVDVSSGVEKSPGRKDHGLVERFITEAKNKEK